MTARPFVAVLALAGFMAIGSACTTAPAGPVTPTGTAAPTVAPAKTPTPSQPTVTPSPSTPATDPFTFALEDLTGHQVTLAIKDSTDSLVQARSGKPGDGMSVRWGHAKVENVDAQTLRVVWVALPRDEAVAFGITGSATDLRIVITQAAPPPYSDALGVDRVVHLQFDAPVRAEDVKVAFK
jgi:hypothetical protein